MRRLVTSMTSAGCLVLMLGCGVTSAEVQIGDSVTLGVHHARSGETLVAVVLSGRACGSSAWSVAWNDAHSWLAIQALGVPPAVPANDVEAC